jgi:hypothetical protein
MTDRGSWRRNQFAVTAASFVGFTGFTLVMQTSPARVRFIDTIHIEQSGVVRVRF